MGTRHCKPRARLRRGAPGAIALLGILFGLLASGPSAAGPFAYPGDLRLRHQIQFLKDQGATDSLTTTWPLTLPDVAADLADDSPREGAAAYHLHQRMKSRLRQASRQGLGPASISVAALDDPILLRSFQDTPRGRGEAEVRAQWMSDHLALRLQGQAVRDAPDGKDYRADGSYAGLLMGNWVLSGGAMPRWWGPGWSGSALLSTNARPVPAIAIDRNYTDAFDLPVLRWLGDWRVSAFMGQLGGDRVVPEAKLFGLRFVMQPVDNLEIGLTRMAQWGGEGRPEDAEAFADILVGKDNQGGDAGSKEPGNQLAGIDFRLASPFPAFPLALYGQAAGEDEANGLPFKWMGLAGVEGWGSMSAIPGTYRLYAEVSESSLYYEGAAGNTAFNTAYEHHIYGSGYRFRGRSLGLATDNDSTLASVGGVLALTEGMTWHSVLRWGKINRDGAGSHSLYPEGADLVGGLLSGKMPTSFGALEAGVEANRIDPQPVGADADTDTSVYIRWTWQEGRSP